MREFGMHYLGFEWTISALDSLARSMAAAGQTEMLKQVRKMRDDLIDMQIELGG